MLNNIKHLHTSLSIMAGAWLLLLTAACSNLDSDERLVVINTHDVDTTAVDTADIDNPDLEDSERLFLPQKRGILIEDYTGQDCVNCPEATELIGRICQIVADTAGIEVIPVAIHSGPLGVMPSASHPDGLATELGNTYYRHWACEYQPMGLIDRSDGVLGKEDWEPKVRWDLSQLTSKIAATNIVVEPTYDEASRQLNVKVSVAAVKNATTGNLQVWLTEDQVVAFQKYPNNVTKADNIHNHVLRTSLNGTWGEEVNIAETEFRELNYSCTLAQGWNAQNLSVVAFVANDSGLLQVRHQHIRQ